MVERREPPFAIAVIGAGLYGLSTVERLIASIPELLPGREVRIHLIDPFLGRGSRTWRTDQPAELWMNSLAGQMTLFPDDSSTCVGPVRKGPGLREWAATSGEALSTDENLDPLLGPFSPFRYASRRIMGAYMEWFLDHLEEQAPPGVGVQRHEKLVVDVTASSDPSGEAVLVWLAGEARPLRCRRVVLAQGRPSLLPAPEQRALTKALAAHGGSHAAPGRASATRAAHIRPGEGVLLRGLGLTFFDYLQLFTTLRGGTFRSESRGVLVYEPSGQEPRIFATSRSGVPTCPIPWSPVTPPLTRCPSPRFTSSGIFRALARSRDLKSALQEATRRMTAELEYFYYAELLSSEPERFELDRDGFCRLFARHAAGSAAQRDLVASVVPEEHRLDLKRLTDPLGDKRFDDLGSLQSWMRTHIARSTNRGLSGRHSCDLALREGLHYLVLILTCLSAARDSSMSPEGSAFLEQTRAWARSRIQFLSGGAPWPRQRELLALSRSGVVTFLGKGAELTFEPGTKVLRCGSRNAPASVVVKHVIEARHSVSSMEATTDPLHRKLYGRGQLTTRRLGRPVPGKSPVPELMAVTRNGRLLNVDGDASRTLYGVGADTTNPIMTPGLPRARSDSDVFLLTDRVARDLLSSLQEARSALSVDDDPVVPGGAVSPSDTEDSSALSNQSPLVTTLVLPRG